MRELGRMTGVPWQTIQSILLDQDRSPTMDTVASLLDGLGYELLIHRRRRAYTAPDRQQLTVIIPPPPLNPDSEPNKEST